MLKYVVQRHRQVLVTRLACRNNHAVQQQLLAVVMKRRVQLHRHRLVVVVAGCLLEARRARVMPAGKHMSESLDDRLVVCGDRLSRSVCLHRGVGVQLTQTDGEKLHQLTGIVLIRSNVQRGIRLLIAQHAEINAHRRMQCHDLQQVPIISECIQGKLVVVIGD